MYRLLILLFTFFLVGCNVEEKQKGPPRNVHQGDHTLLTEDSLSLLAIVEKPKESATAVLILVHGLGEYYTTFDSFAPFLVENGFAVVRFDLRGHGYSDGVRGHLSSYDLLMKDLDTVLAFVEEEFQNTPIFFYGHSLGGNLVLNHLLRSPGKVTGAIVAAPYFKSTTPPPWWKMFFGKILKRVNPDHQLESGVKSELTTRDRLYNRKCRNDRLQHSKVTSSFLEVIEAGKWAQKNAALLKEPLLVMHAGADSITLIDGSVEFADRAGDMATLKLWEGYYHELHNDLNKEVVFSFVCQWITVQILKREEQP